MKPYELFLDSEDKGKLNRYALLTGLYKVEGLGQRGHGRNAQRALGVGSHFHRVSCMDIR